MAPAQMLRMVLTYPGLDGTDTSSVIPIINLDNTFDRPGYWHG